MQRLTPELADRFARIALGHVGREFPNAPGLVLNGPHDEIRPRALHPVFYGSFDWHSSVHSHWLLARILRRFPGIGAAPATRTWLESAFTPQGVAGEAAYLDRPQTAAFERPYGWAWLMMLQAELEAHQTPEGRRWARTMRLLTSAFERRLMAWLPIATYPVRVGTHGSTAFALILFSRYAPHAADAGLVSALRDAAASWYGGDRDCPAWEPSGADFLSPALVEAACMADVLPAPDFAAWLAAFLPDLERSEPEVLFSPALVSDRRDPQIAHLDGLNLSRAWCFRRLARAAPALAGPLRQAAERHLEAALPHLADDYMGEHWLASFALLALDDDDAG